MPGRDALIGEIFEWTAQVQGCFLISAKLNKLAETDPFYKPWRGTHWRPDVIAKLTRNRAVLGEYQPHKTRANPDKPLGGRNNNRRPIIREKLDVIPGYFPPVIGLDLWQRAQAAKAKMIRGKSGPPGAERGEPVPGPLRLQRL